jgi:tetratricopeptide (TPR) repeat protein
MNSCPSAETLELLLAGRLAEPDTGKVRSHLAACPSCRTLLDHLSDDTDLRGWLPDDSSLPPEPPPEPGQVRLLDRLRAAPVAEAAARPLAFLGPPQREGDVGVLGPYRVQAELGHGGMGIVLRGYDEGLRRTVALKVLRPERAGAAARGRFVREAQLAAQCKHDHIVSVYAVVDPPDGPPYLVMEQLAGPTLAELIRQRKWLQPREAAELVAQVAGGLAAAHAAGLIHRDIKPSNIMLDNARAKLMDFGLARLSEQPSGLTEDGVLAGTPAYMSPEQARGAEALDARTDVYSLGATLYEALTGEVPFRGTPHLVLQQVRSDEPRPPRRLNDAVPRDLETICLKAMAKEPGLRYQTALALAEDLGRWQRGEPIKARPVGPGGRLLRWCRRKPVVAGLTSALVLVVVCGVAGVVWQWRRAEAKSVEAIDNAAKAQEQRQLALDYLKDSQTNFRDARRAVDTFFTLAEKHNVFQQAMGSPLNKQLLEETLRYYQAFVTRKHDDPSARDELAEAYSRVGFLTFLTGDPAKALTSYQQAVAEYRNLLRAQPADDSLRKRLAHCLLQVGETCRKLGRSAEALRACEEARDEWDRMSRADPSAVWLRQNVSAALGNIANVHGQLGHHAEALANYHRAKEIQEQIDHDFPTNEENKFQLAKTLNNLAGMTAAKDPDASLKYLEQGIAVREALHKASPNSDLYQFELARSCSSMGGYLSDRKKATEALAYYDRAIELLRRAVKAQPNRIDYPSELALAWERRGQVLVNAGRLAEALAAFEEMRRLLEPVVAAAPSERGLRQNLAVANGKTGWMLRELNRPAESLAAVEKELKLWAELVRAAPDNATFRQGVTQAQEWRVRLQSSIAADKRQ